MPKAQTKKATKSKRTKTGKLAVGDRVKFKLAGRRVSGRIVEDRGNLGARGRRIIAVHTKIAKNSSVIEIPAEEVRRDAQHSREKIMPGKKSGKFTRDGIDKLAAGKPAVYEIRNKGGKNIYTGSAKKGRVRERLAEHLPGGKDPVRGGESVRLLQKSSIKEAQKTEARIIQREKPPQNKQGK